SPGADSCREWSSAATRSRPPTRTASTPVEWSRASHLGEVRPVALDDEGAVEPEHLAHERAVLVAVVEYDGVDPDVGADQLEVEVGVALQTLSPVGAQCFLAANDAVRAVDDPGRDR